MPLRCYVPAHFTQKDAIYRYLNGEFDIEKRFDIEKKAFHPSSQVESGEWERSEVLESDTALWFFVFLAIGKIEAAGYLADCCNRNMGVTATGNLKYNLSNFAFNLGAILGDEDCIEILQNETTTSQIKTNAHKVAQLITKNANDFAEFQKEGKQIYLKDVFGYAKSLDGDIYAYTGFSYILNMAESDFRYYLSQTKFEEVETHQLIGESPAPDSCCVIM